jgi:small conductance mechanosensitive channel
MRALWLWLPLLLALAPIPLAAESEEHELVVEERALLEGLDDTRSRRDALEARLEKARGAPRQILEEQTWQITTEASQILHALAANLVQQREAGLDTEKALHALKGRVREVWPNTLRRIRKREEAVQAIVTERDAAGPNQRAELENEATRLSRALVQHYAGLVDSVLTLEEAGLDLPEPRAFLVERLTYHSDYLAAAAAVAIREQGEIRAHLADTPGDADAQAALVAAESWVERSTENLHATADLMERLDMQTTHIRQLLFETTGEITTEVLDREVALGLVERWRSQASDVLVEHGPRWLLRALVFLAILGAFRLLAVATRRVIIRSLAPSRVQISQLLRDSLVSWSSRGVMIVGLMVAVSQLGVEIGPMLAGLGIAGFILGFAMQDSLANFAAGAMILIYRPFDVNDLIEAAGVRGTVRRMTLVSTTILTLDNQTLIIPNGKIWGDVIRNVTAQRLRRVDLVFGISYESSVDQADEILHAILKENPRVLDEPEARVEVHELGESSVDFVVRPWVKTEDYWEVHWEITREVKKRFDAAGISIPYPQRDVHVRVPSASTGEPA